MDNALDKLLDYQDKHYSGIIVYYSKKYDGIETDVPNCIADVLLKPVISNICSLSVNIGFAENEITHTIEVAGYKKFQVLVPPSGFYGSVHNISVDTDFDTPMESGLQIKIDVNTRLQAKRNVKGAFALLLPCVIDTIKNKAPHLLGELKPTTGV
jgi:hypothetical protein